MAGEGTPANRSDTGGETAGQPPLVPNHTLLSLIARGSYGEVWLARSELGQMRAVKLVYRKRFKDAKPYEREFAGIKRFEPISREHEGFVDILQVGLNEAEGFFFYVMELADAAPIEGTRSQCSVISDQSPASPHLQTASPDLPSPRPDLRSPISELRSPISHLPSAISAPPPYAATTLLSEIQRLGRLPFDRVLALGIRLAEALEFLHRQGLVHRDIKPSNIIFVNGQPKLADVGLVADLGDPRSFVGTEGYIPPEGPGTAQADLYSLGKVLYEAATGKDRHDFPQVGTAVEEMGAENVGEPAPGIIEGEHPKVRGGALLELNEVLLRCCDRNTKLRYQCVAMMLADLRRLEGGTSLRWLRQQRSRLNLIAAALGVISLLIFGGGTALELVRTHRTKPQLLFQAPFESRELPKGLWISSGRPTGDRSTGKRSVTLEPGAGQLVLRVEASMTSANSDSVSVDAWVDLQKNLKELRPCSLVLEFSGEAQGGICAATISDGSSPRGLHEFGVSLWRWDAWSGHTRNLTNRWESTKIRVDFPETADVAIVYPSAAHLDQFDLVDLKWLDSWRLRFHCLAGTSPGFESSRAELRLAAFAIYSNPGGPSLVGRVVEKMSERGIRDVLVALEDGRVIARSTGSGAMLLTNVLGAEVFLSKNKYKSDRVRLPRGVDEARSLLMFPLEKVVNEVGDVVETIPYGDFPIASIGFRGDQLWALASGGQPGSYFLKVDPERREISVGLDDSLVEPSLNSFVQVGGRLLGLEHWHGTLYEITSAGASKLHSLFLDKNKTTAMDWSWSCAFDGGLCWFIEADFMRGRSFLHGLNLENGTIEHLVESTDPRIRSLAWDGHQFWLSSDRGVVCALDREAAVRTKSVRLAQTGVEFLGNYTSLAYGDGFLWGLELEKKRICKIRILE